MFENQSEVHGIDRKYIKVCGGKLKSQTGHMSHFDPYANFSFPYLQIDLCNLYPVELECIIFVLLLTSDGYVSHSPWVVIIPFHGLPDVKVNVYSSCHSILLLCQVLLQAST